MQDHAQDGAHAWCRPMRGAGPGKQYQHFHQSESYMAGGARGNLIRVADEKT